jgi:hypothetical protein
LYGFEGPGIEFVFYALAKFSMAKPDQTHPMLMKENKKMGMAMDPSKKYVNVIQMLFIEDILNVLA